MIQLLASRKLSVACLAFIACTACRGGYRSSSHSVSFMHGLQVENFTLSARAPVHRELGVRLVSIAPDRTVTLELLGNHQRLSAKPGHAFACEEFGQSGLVLESASPSQQTAALSRTFCATTVRR